MQNPFLLLALINVSCKKSWNMSKKWHRLVSYPLPCRQQLTQLEGSISWMDGQAMKIDEDWASISLDELDSESTCPQPPFWAQWAALLVNLVAKQQIGWSPKWLHETCHLPRFIKHHKTVNHLNLNPLGSACSMDRCAKGIHAPFCSHEDSRLTFCGLFLVIQGHQKRVCRCFCGSAWIIPLPFCETNSNIIKSRTIYKSKMNHWI